MMITMIMTIIDDGWTDFVSEGVRDAADELAPALQRKAQPAVPGLKFGPYIAWSRKGQLEGSCATGNSAPFNDSTLNDPPLTENEMPSY